MPALAVLQVLTGGVWTCRQAGLPVVSQPEHRDALNRIDSISCPSTQLHCRAMFDIGAEHVRGS